MGLLENPVVLAIIVALGVAMTTVGALLLLQPAIDRGIDRFVADFDDKFVFGLEFKPLHNAVIWMFLGACAITSGLFFYFFPLVTATVSTFVLFGGLALLPHAIYLVSVRGRVKEIEAILPGLLQQLSANFRHNSDKVRGLQEVAETAASPMDHELRILANKTHELGFIQALENSRGRIKSDMFDTVAALLQTTSIRGGSEAEALSNLSRVFAQLRAMRDRIDTATRQGRASMWIILMAPFVLIPVGLFGLPDTIWEGIDLYYVKLVIALAAVFAFISITLAIWFTSQEV